MVAFIRFCLEVFLQTFYATLPCFCKCKKCGFGWCQTFPIFSHILLNFWILENDVILFLYSRTNQHTNFSKSAFDFMADSTLAPQIPCIQNQYAAFKIDLKYSLAVYDTLTATKIWKKSLRTKLQNLTWKILSSSWCKNTGLKSNITSL